MTDLGERALSFLAKFNERDLQGILDTFADDGVFVDQNGLAHQGEPALRAAYGPLCDGSRGDLHYEVGETVLDESANTAVVTWTLRIKSAGSHVSTVRGLDILRFEGEKLKSKNAFCKAREVLVE